MNSTGVRQYIAAFVSVTCLLAAASGASYAATANCPVGLTPEQRLAQFKAADQQAEASMHAAQFARAVASYKEAVCLVPDSARGWYGLGVAQAGAGQFREARESLATADRLRPVTPMPLIMQVRANASLKDEAALKANLRELARRFPRDPNAHATLVRFLAEQNLLDLALAEALRSDGAGPVNPTAKLQLAGLENTAGAYTDAARTALVVMGESAALQEMRAAAAGIAGLSYESLGQTEQGIEYLKQAVALDPAQENSYLALADLYDKLQRYREAADLLLQARTHLPDSTAILLPLGTDLIRAERYAEGVGVIREVIQRAPDTDEAYVRLADAAHRTGDVAQELRTLQQLQERRPNYPMIDVLIARAMLAQEHVNYDAALHQLAAAERTSPKDPEIYALRGRVYMERKQYGQAIDPLRRSIELYPLDAANYYQLARAYQKLGKADLAAEQFERVKMLDSKAK